MTVIEFEFNAGDVAYKIISATIVRGEVKKMEYVRESYQSSGTISYKFKPDRDNLQSCNAFAHELSATKEECMRKFIEAQGMHATVVEQQE